MVVPEEDERGPGRGVVLVEVPVPPGRVMPGRVVPMLPAGRVVPVETPVGLILGLMADAPGRAVDPGRVAAPVPVRADPGPERNAVAAAVPVPAGVLPAGAPATAGFCALISGAPGRFSR